MTVLIINDEAWTAEMIREDVDWISCGVEEVRTAYDASQAREEIIKGDIDILLCDIEMPGESGIALMRKIREEGYGMACVFLTCHADFAYAQEAIRLDCQDYVLMPARPEEIQRVVSKVVRKVREKEQSGQLEQYGARWIEGQRNQAREDGPGKKSPRDIVSECEGYSQRSLSDPELSVQMVAAYVHLNPVYLNRIFRKERGSSIAQFIIQERMKLAARLLEDTQISAAAVAERTGYREYSYFSTSFKKYYGCSPQHYIQRRKETE